jgi:hypothetical protein
LYGGNPELRKEIRQRRDHWYELCLEKPPIPPSTPLEQPERDYLEAVVRKYEDWEHIYIDLAASITPSLIRRPKVFVDTGFELLRARDFGNQFG